MLIGQTPIHLYTNHNFIILFEDFYPILQLFFENLE